jgi:hypothetical protein
MMMKDSSEVVRSAVAKRLPIDLVQEMLRKFPRDEGLMLIERTKRLEEKGMPNPKIDDEEFDIYGEEPMAELIGDIDHPGLTDAWYTTVAEKMVHFYGANIEGQWEEIAVKRYCDSVWSMGVEVDYEKLLDAVFDILETRTDKALEEGSFASLAARLRSEDFEVMPIISETTDVVTSLASSNLSSSEYIKKFEETFSVCHATSNNPAYRILKEGNEKVVHPISAKLPGKIVRSVDERAIDTYVNAWNSRQQLSNKVPYKLVWAHDAESYDIVNFNLELK